MLYWHAARSRLERHAASYYRIIKTHYLQDGFSGAPGETQIWRRAGIKEEVNIGRMLEISRLASHVA